MDQQPKWSKLEKCSNKYIFCFISTPYSIRARELMQIYNTITMKFLTLDERLDILLTLKHTVKVCGFKNEFIRNRIMRVLFRNMIVVLHKK
jgi:hypothetical protein